VNEPNNTPRRNLQSAIFNLSIVIDASMQCSN
jgi:hypothetical protein